VIPEHGWVEFDGVIELMPWGRNVYTILRVEGRLEAKARAAGTRRVEGTIEGVTVNAGLNRADVIPEAFIYVGKSLKRRHGSRAGDVVRCRLRPVDPDEVPLADDVHRALADGGRLTGFERRTPAERRRLLQPIEEAVKAETRQRRILALLSSLPPA
jgi:hypothetical protein